MSDNRLPPAQLRRAAIKVVETAKVDAFAYLLSFSGASPDEAPILKDEILAALHSAAENERLRSVLATVRIFIEGEPIANAVVAPEGQLARGDHPSLLNVIDAALGLDQQLGQQEKP